MLFRRPGIHGDANLGNQAEGGSFIDSVDLSQIPAADSKRFFSSVEFHQIPLPFLGTPGGLEITAWLCLSFQTSDMLGNWPVAFRDRLRVVVKGVSGLLQSKPVLGSVVALHGFLDWGLARLSSGVSHCRQFLAIPLASDDGSNNLHPG